MPKPPRDKDFPIFSSSGPSTGKKKATTRLTACSTDEDKHGEIDSPEATCSTTMDQILIEIKSVASRVNNMDEAVEARLNTINSTLGDIKTSITSVELSLSNLSNRATDLEKRMDEAETRISNTEDSRDNCEAQISAMQKIVDMLQLKVDDLENRGRRKNLKIVNLPEKAEGSTSLADFLQITIPTLVGLPADFPPLEIERAHRALVPSPVATKPPRSILVRFLRYSQKEAVLRAALKKRDILYNESRLRFYSDLSAEVLRKRREFDSVGKSMARRNMYRGFAYPARLRCLHNGQIRLFDTPESAAAFLESLT
ncbi:hypothetical protein M9458_052510 [Cirrhinus mrigala]|uniref:L1 transposable element RRM domain-containing protein n=1 Tax=Cirrhinus mrigala TaxID=683832 RepID=A0ABD0MVF4_CIRMR